MKLIIVLICGIAVAATGVQAEVVRWESNAPLTEVQSGLPSQYVGTTSGWWDGRITNGMAELPCADLAYVAEAVDSAIKVAKADPVNTRGVMFDVDKYSRCAVQWGAVALLLFGSLAVVGRRRRKHINGASGRTKA